MTIRIETERLLLRPFGPADVENHVAMMADPLVAKTLTADGKPRSRGEEWRMAATLIGRLGPSDLQTLLVELSIPRVGSSILTNGRRHSDSLRHSV